jgi:putative DNA primase/helicase
VAALATAAGAASIAIVAVPAEWPEGWDIADTLPDGAAQDVLAELRQSAIPWTPATARNEPGGKVDDVAEIARLAGLPLIEYGRERKAAAQRLGCSALAILDKAVAAERDKGGAVSGQGRPLDLHAPESWPEPVESAVLIAELAAAIRRHVVLSTAEADAVALWVIAVHAFDAWFIFPRLFINSPEKGCGKSTLLDVLSRLVPKPLVASSISAPALFRVIEAARPTLLLDEAETYARNNEDLRGVLDAGHRRDGAVIRTVGDDHEPRQFSAWSPAALAAIGRLPGTIEDRSITIGLRRRRPDERVESLRLDRVGHLEDLARKAARWAADHADELAAADPSMPEGIINRVADNWHPLLAVADLAGADWPERARRVAVELSADGDDQSSIRIALLADIRAAFRAKRVDRLSSDELAFYLGGLEHRPWPDYHAGKPISKPQIARLLKPLGISSGTIRLPNGSTPKGYYLTAFRDPFARYLPAENATAPQPKDFRGSAPDLKAPHRNCCGVLEMSGMASFSAACGAVADRLALPDNDEFQERAGIIENDGGYPRAEAERRARAELSGQRDKSLLQ